jgi:hypothetical protein
LFVFVLCLAYPMLPVFLDCPFFINNHLATLILFEIVVFWWRNFQETMKTLTPGYCFILWIFSISVAEAANIGFFRCILM